MKNVTAIVISFLRPEYTVACIKSLRATYPDINIIVGENGRPSDILDAAITSVGAEYVRLPFDSGVCYARNMLMTMVQTPYVLVGDDDFFYDTDTGVDRMLRTLERNPGIDLIGGRVREGGAVRNYQGSIEREGRWIKNTPIDLDYTHYTTDNETGMRFIKTDLVFNFFVARTEKIRPIPWDKEIKVAYEHESWFIDLQDAGVNVYFSPDPIVTHKPEHVLRTISKENHEQYRTYRSRRSDKEYFFRKHDLNYVIDMHGRKDYAPDHVVERTKNDTKYVDFCITTFKRPEALERLLISIARYYPMANIYVADQNETFDREFYRNLRDRLMMQWGLLKRPCFEHLEYDCGVSVARNHLVTTTPNKYKLILDDDFEFTEQTDIGKMVKLLDIFPGAGIVGGMVRQLGSEVHFEFTPEKRGDTIYHVTEKPAWKNYEGIKYRKTGCVLNFALMRKELFSHLWWDPQLKVTEHTDFYLRMKSAPYYVLYTPSVVVEHPPISRSLDYQAHRTRDEFMRKMFQKHGVRRVKYENGTVFEVTPDGIKKYKEPV